MCPIWKKEFLVKIGGFDESYQRFQDAELHTKALLNDKVTYHVFKDLQHDCYFRVEHEQRGKDFWGKVTDAYVYYANQIIQIENLNKSLYKTAVEALSYFGAIYCLQASPQKAQEVITMSNCLREKHYISCSTHKILNSILSLFKSGLLFSIFHKAAIRILLKRCFKKLNAIG